MAKVKLSPGAELDVLSPEELETILKRLRDERASGFDRPANTHRDFDSFKTDSNGNSGIVGASLAGNPRPVPLFPIKPGLTLDLHRLTVQFEGVAFGTKYASGYMYLMRASRLVDFADLSIGTPVVFSYTSDAPVYTGNEAIELLISAGPANTNIVCDLQGTLSALPGTFVYT